VIAQIGIGLALRHDPFEVVFARQSEETFTIAVNVVTVEQPFASLRNERVKPGLAVDQRQIAQVFAISESAVLLIIVGLSVFIPEDVEGIEQGLGASEQKIAELRLARRIEANNFAVEHTVATLEVASQSRAQTGKALERVAVARYEPHAVFIALEQRPKAVPFDLEKPVRVREGLTGAAERQWPEYGQWH